MSEYEESKVMLLERGMTEEQVENFLTRGHKVTYQDVFIPGDRVIDTLRELAKLSIIAAPVQVRFCVSRNRYEEFIAVAGKASGREVIDGTRKPGDLTH